MSINESLSKQLSKELLSFVNMDEALFKSYVSRLKAKGLIVKQHGTTLTKNTKFCINIVDGNISVLYKKLIEFLENEY